MSVVGLGVRGVGGVCRDVGVCSCLLVFVIS